VDVTDRAGSIGRAVQSQIYRAGALGRRPAVPVSPDRLERAARRRMSPRAWAYVAGAAGQQRTAQANLDAFDRWRIVPRMLRDVAVRDTTVELFGRDCVPRSCLPRSGCWRWPIPKGTSPWPGPRPGWMFP
jgi:hypothetical protein